MARIPAAPDSRTIADLPSGAAGPAPDPVLRVAWLYYVEGLTQASIGEALGVARARVIALLADARERGIVRTRVIGRTAAQRRLEDALVRRFGVREAVVAPQPVDQGRTAAIVGFAAGQHLAGALARAAGVAVGWGATLRAAVAAVPPSAPPAHASRGTVVSMLGGALESGAVTPFEVARRLAEVLGTHCHPLNAPLFVASDSMRDALWAEPALRELRRQVRAANLALVSVGDMTEGATLFAAGLVPPVVREELQARGAVGDLLGQFIDAEGRPIDHPLNGRVMAIAASELATVSRVVLASGGARKAAVMRAALRALPVATLVTDEAAAAALLAHG